MWSPIVSRETRFLTIPTRTGFLVEKVTYGHYIQKFRNWVPFFDYQPLHSRHCRIISYKVLVFPRNTRGCNKVDVSKTKKGDIVINIIHVK